MALYGPLFKDRVVDDLNPVLNFTRKEVESLLHFVEEEPGQISVTPPEGAEEVIYKACQLHPHLITKVQPPQGFGLRLHLTPGSNCLRFTTRVCSIRLS